MKLAKSILWVVVVILLFNSPSLSWHWVCVDPGHGGIHSGTVGRVYGLLEKDVNLGVGHTAWTYFGLANYNVIMTRFQNKLLLAGFLAILTQQAHRGFISILRRGPTEGGMGAG